MVSVFIVSAIIIVILTIALFAFSYVKAPPDMAYVISSFKKKPRILTGRAGFKIPFFERLDKMYLGSIQIDVKTNNAVPTAEFININVDATVSIRISQDPKLIQIAAQNFLNISKDGIAEKVNDLLEGNMREIAGNMKLVDMVSDRKAFNEKVQENAVPDLARFGLELVSFNVQNFSDDNSVITNLGIDNVETIRKAAAIAKAEAERDIAIKKSEAAQQANNAQVMAAEQIAERNAELERKQAALKRDVDTQAAQAEAAKAIEAENQRKLKDVAATNANIAKAEREAELKQKQVELKEYELDAMVRKEADAKKYTIEKQAEAELIRRQKEAEAKAYEVVQQFNAEKVAAEARKYIIQQDAEAQKAKAVADKFSAEQKAAGITAIGIAEAEAIEKKALAQKKMGEASILEMYFKTLPQIVQNAAAPLTNVDKIIMYGDGNSSKLIGDVMKTSNQIIDGIKESTGIDLNSVISSIGKENN